MDKTALLAEIEAELRRELATLTRAAKDAHVAATHEESRSEDKHDTRGIEASYLAGAQAARAAEIERQLQIFQSIPHSGPQSGTRQGGERIASGSLVELESGGRRSFYLLSPSGGGLTLKLAAGKIQVITPASPLGEALLGAREGDEIEVELGAPSHESKSYRILTVR